MSRFAALPILNRQKLQIPPHISDFPEDGISLAHLSDFHAGDMTPERLIRAAVERCNEANVDVVLLTGDFVSWRRREIPVMKRQLNGLTAPLVIAVLGNHDYYASATGVATALRDNGYIVLRNDLLSVQIRGHTVHFVGIDDPITHHHRIGASFAKLEDKNHSGNLIIALCHDPERGPEIAKHGAHMIFSGHTHGGQIYLPGITKRLAKRAGKRFLVGLYNIDNTKLYVTPGVGFSGIRIRVGMPAEVAVFDLAP